MRIAALVLGLLVYLQIEDVEYPLVNKTPIVRVPRDETCLLRCDAECDKCLAESEVEGIEACETARETCYTGC